MIGLKNRAIVRDGDASEKRGCRDAVPAVGSRHEGGTFCVVVLPSFVVVERWRKSSRPNDAPPRDLTAVQRHDATDAARGTRAERCGDLAIAHHPAGWNRLDDVEDNRNDVVR